MTFMTGLIPQLCKPISPPAARRHWRLRRIVRVRLPRFQAPNLPMSSPPMRRSSNSLGKVQSHAQLLFAANTNDPAIAKHHQSIREVGAEIGASLLFVELELARLDEGHVQKLLGDAGLARFSPWLRRVRAMAPYQLSDEIEKMIAERAPTGAGAWVRLFDETTTAMRFAFQGTDVTEAEILDALSSTMQPSAKRQASLYRQL